MYSANCGDARTVICEKEQAFRISYDHKPNLPEEIERIKKMGGVIERGRVQGVLAGKNNFYFIFFNILIFFHFNFLFSVSRAFGDSKMQPFVTCDPFIKVYDINDNTTHVVVACDGLWDVVNENKKNNKK